MDGGELKDIREGYAVDHVSFTEPGQSVEVSFAEPLAAGTYVFTCYIPKGGFKKSTPKNAPPHIKLGMIAILTVS